MPKHKSEDYKLSAVKFYLDNNATYAKTCKIFKCSERSLKRWIDRYKKDGNLKRKHRKSISYKVKNKHVKYALELLKNNQQITLKELAKLVKKKYDDFNII